MPSHDGREYSIDELAQQARVILQPTPCNICGTIYECNRVIARHDGLAMLVCVDCMGKLDYLMDSTEVLSYISNCLCDNCHDLVPTSSLKLRDGMLICEQCYFMNSWVCYYCQNRYGESEEPYSRIENEQHDEVSTNVCNNCHSHNYDLILPYSFDPQFKFYKTNKDKHELLYFGIELEVESNGNDKREVVESLPSCVYVKADSSIMNGFEIVSHPMTYNWLIDNCKVWNKILDLRKKGWRSYDTESCGMHIHLSKNAFGNYHLYKFMKLFYDNHDFILRFSQRKGIHLNQWASLNDNEQNIIYKARNKNRGREDRHTAVNLEREFSVEVRVFRGTLNPLSFWKNIEFTKALFDFSRDYALESMREIEFRNFIRFERKRYPNLHSFMWDRDKTKYIVEM